MKNLPEFCVFFFASSASTALLHAGILRLRPDANLLKSSVLSSGLIGLLVAAVTGGSPSGMGVAAWIASFFFYQLFFFLGPATADRSLTAHLLILLRRAPGACLDEARVLQRHDAESCLQKRLLECSDAGLMTRAQGRLGLKPRGDILARLYMLLIRCYGLERRKAWKYSFRFEGDNR